jgi:predicted enzyme related to lactoylglutathione lyase
MRRFSLELNWFGIAVHDVPAAADFYNKELGLAYIEDEAHGQWRQFKTRRMLFEMFEAHANRFPVTAWGQGQAFRPVILVPDLSAAAEMLQEKNITHSYTGARSGSQLEMIGPEGFRWSLQEASMPSVNWTHPVIGGVELKAANLNAQKEFYTQIAGMNLEADTGDGFFLTQAKGKVWLRIIAGGKEAPIILDQPGIAFFHPIWLSFETQAVENVNECLQDQDVTIVQPLTYHPDWLGTDILLGDADGNVIQIVQYGRRESAE